MKILHTSDWHLGLTVYHFDRLPEQLEMLRQIRDIAADEKVDALIVSGDLYHTDAPGAIVQRTLTDALIEIRNACPGMTIVITSGNHDSAAKHVIFQTPWKALGINMIGAVDGESPEDSIIEIPGKGWIVAVPFVHQRNLPEGIYQRLLDLVAERNKDNLPVVMMAHTAVSGCNFTGHDNATEITVGGIDAVDVETFGTGYDYLALGHIHKPHTLPSPQGIVRYSGTPLAVNFDERYSHSVSIVDLQEHGEEVTVRETDIEDPCPMVTIPADGSFTDIDTALAEFSDFPSENRAYIRLNVETTGYLPPDSEERAKTIAEDKECRYCLINTRHKAAEGIDGREHHFTISELRSKSPLEIAEAYMNDRNMTLEDDMRDMLSEILKDLQL